MLSRAPRATRKHLAVRRNKPNDDYFRRKHEQNEQDQQGNLVAARRGIRGGLRNA
jgi:hypothetical protein